MMEVDNLLEELFASQEEWLVTKSEHAFTIEPVANQDHLEYED
ncbi:hypothetical protein [Paenibacillus sp. SYP-B3998]|nr:hypothetical protein [Paenibacillus sp. SYP-B3998]